MNVVRDVRVGQCNDEHGMTVQYNDERGESVWHLTDRLIVTLADGQQFNVTEGTEGLQVEAHPRIALWSDSSKVVVLKAWE